MKLVWWKLFGECCGLLFENRVDVVDCNEKYVVMYDVGRLVGY